MKSVCSLLCSSETVVPKQYSDSNPWEGLTPMSGNRSGLRFQPLVHSNFMKSTNFLFVSAIFFSVSVISEADTVHAIASSSWALGSTWSDGFVPSASNDYIIDGETVNSPSAAGAITNTLDGTSLTVSSGALQFWSSTGSSVTSSLTVPNFTLNGGQLTFANRNTGFYNQTFDFGSPIAVGGSANASADNLNAFGNVSIAVGTTLTTRDIATTPAVLTLGTELVLINHSGYALTGTFDGLAEGAEITAGLSKFLVSYNNSSRVTLTANGSAGGFASWTATNAPGQTIDQDHDGDGVPNGIEYFMGQSGSGFTATPGIVGGKVSWPKGSSYTGAYGTDYGVQTSPDLSHWTDATIGAGPGFVTDGNPVEFTLPTAAPKTFVRLKVTGP